jgi:hypothetical protein
MKGVSIMRKIMAVTVATLILAWFGVGTAQAQQLSPAGLRAYRNANTALNNVSKDPALFDGKQLGPNARLDRCKNFVRTNKENLNRAVDNFNKIPASDRSAPEVKEMEKKIREMTEYLTAMDAAVQALEQGGKAADDQCRAFENEIMKPVDNRTVMSTLARALQDPAYVQYNRPEQITKALEVVKAVAAVCAKDAYKNVGKVGCNWMKVGGPDRDPSAWCAAAAKGTELVQQAVKAFVKAANERSAKQVMTPEELERGDGWLKYEEAVKFQDHLHFGDVLKAKLLAQFKPAFDAAGLQGADDPALFAGQVDAMDKLRAAVEKLAPTWKLPPAKSCNYGCDKAKTQIVKWYKSAASVSISLKKTIMSTGEWHITKNALGIPLERSMQGYVLFQVPGEKFCQLRPFTLTETYSGAGKYQKADGVRFGFVRFQNCQ